MLQLLTLIFVMVLWAPIALAKTHSTGTHQFSKIQCRLCHVPKREQPADIELKDDIGQTCAHCHQNRAGELSHPLNVIPAMVLPKGMPLAQGRLSCLTCHYAHPDSEGNRPRTMALLRKPGRGAAFCRNCHRSEKGTHLIYGTIHVVSSRKSRSGGRLDQQSLQCAECHDRHVSIVSKAAGTGRWQPFDPSRANHPVGVSYPRSTSTHPRNYQPAGLLPREIRLYDGKIGCGTCHNIYSKEKKMLVLDNSGSHLCLSCHII